MSTQPQAAQILPFRVVPDPEAFNANVADNYRQRCAELRRMDAQRFCHDSFPAGPGRTAELGATCGRCGGNRAMPVSS